MNKNRLNFPEIQDTHLDQMIRLAFEQETALWAQQLIAESEKPLTSEQQEHADRMLVRMMVQIDQEERTVRRRNKIAHMKRMVPRLIEVAACIVLIIGIAAPFAIANIVWMAMILFAGHVLMLTQLQILVHSISNDMRLGILCYIVPVVLSAMMASNVDLLWNEHIPYNWGMVLRTDLFSISGYYIEDMNGLTKWLPQCCLPLEKAVGYQIMAATALFAINHIVMRLLNITSRKQSV